jgi:hypothetical protein
MNNHENTILFVNPCSQSSSWNSHRRQPGLEKVTIRGGSDWSDLSRVGRSLASKHSHESYDSAELCTPCPFCRKSPAQPQQNQAPLVPCDLEWLSYDLFENHIRTVFLSHLAMTRIIQNMLEEDAVPLTENHSAHLTPVVIDLLSNARVGIVTFAPHTTQIFQVLDLALFGVLKKRGQYQFPFRDVTESAHFIKKVYHDFRSTTTDINVWEAFRGFGLRYNIIDEV